MGATRHSVPRSKATTRRSTSSTTISNPVARIARKRLPPDSDEDDQPVHKRQRAHPFTQSAGHGSNSDDNQTDAGEPFIEQPSDEELASEGEEDEETIGSDDNNSKVCDRSKP
jgi:hypothetical protein